MNKLITANKEKLLELCRKNDIIFLALFGSSIRGDFAKDSDVDFIARFSKTKSLLELVKIERKFSELLGRKADLLTEASISPYLREKIKKEMKVFYERPG